jgi:hypothetical protein
MKAHGVRGKDSNRTLVSTTTGIVGTQLANIDKASSRCPESYLTCYQLTGASLVVPTIHSSKRICRGLSPRL